MGGIELPELGEGRFQRSHHPPERGSLLLDDLIVENVGWSAMKAKIAGHGLCIGPLRSLAQHLLACRLRHGFLPLPPASGFVSRHARKLPRGLFLKTAMRGLILALAGGLALAAS